MIKWKNTSLQLSRCIQRYVKDINLEPMYTRRPSIFAQLWLFPPQISTIQTIQIIHPLQHNSHENTLRVVIYLPRSIVLISSEKKSSETKHVLHYHPLLKLST